MEESSTMKLLRFSDENAIGSVPTKATHVMMYHDRYTAGETTGGLSVIFTMMCIIDLFGVFPVVALPKSIITCGIYGIPLVLGVIALQLYTAVLLGRSWILAHEIAPHIRAKSRFPYAAVAELAFGKTTRRIVTFLIDTTVFSAGVPNFIFASQSMQLFWWKITNGDVGITYCVWMVVIGVLLCPLMWLGSPKDMKPLAVMSVFIVIAVAASTWTCIILDDKSPPASGDVLAYTPITRDFLVAYGIIVYQFDIHPMLLTLQVDMKDSRRIHSAVLGAFATTGIMFTVTSFLAAKRYGNNIHSNILQGLPPSIVLYIVALLVTLQLCLSSAVGNSALFQHLEDVLQIPREFCLKRCLIRSSVIALAVFLGESVPRFDLVMGLIGSTLTGPLMFIFPPLFFLKLCYKKSSLPNDDTALPYNKLKNNRRLKNNTESDPTKMALFMHSFDTKYKTFTNTLSRMGEDEMDEYNIKWYDIVLAVIVMLLGIFATALATYSSWSDAISSASFSPPCLLNASAAARSFIERNLRVA